MPVLSDKQLLCHEFLSEPQKMLIDGKWLEAESGKTFDTINPANGEVITKIAEAGKADVDKAVAAARKAFDHGPWRNKMSAAERGQCLNRLADLIEKKMEEIAQLEALDNGRPIKEARLTAPRGVNNFRYYAGWATKLEGETINVNNNFFTYTLREPIGVAAQIYAWNSPLNNISWKLGPALACGNTVVLKPAEQAPLVSLYICKLALEAGIPEGVVNIITGFGPNAAGEFLVNHEGIDKIAFTGETSTGKEIVKASARHLKPVSLELGGKAPNIVFADADIDAAVRNAITGIFFNQGQVCCAASRLFLEKSVHDEFMSKMIERASKMRQGPGLDEQTDIGPLVSKEQQQRVLGYIDIAQKEGAKLACGGDAPKGELENGYYVKPTVFASVNNNMRIAQEEVFGPVLAVIPFTSMEEVAEQANKTTYGLSGAVFTSDIKKAHKLASQIKAGTVWINCYNAFDAAMPFGGYKMSGYGRELGKHSIELYTNIKSVWVNLE